MSIIVLHSLSFFFFFNDTATTEIYTLSLHDALPISVILALVALVACDQADRSLTSPSHPSFNTSRDRKSTRLNSSHSQISYAVFCLKKKIKCLVVLRISVLSRCDKDVIRK